jgi:hypothetical protein
MAPAGGGEENDEGRLPCAAHERDSTTHQGDTPPHNIPYHHIFYQTISTTTNSRYSTIHRNIPYFLTQCPTRDVLVEMRIE